jgi:hypothetical protein
MDPGGPAGLHFSRYSFENYANGIPNSDGCSRRDLWRIAVPGDEPGSSSRERFDQGHSAQAQDGEEEQQTHVVRQAKSSRRSRNRRKRGQQAIDSTRAREIQEALIRQHYLHGEPSGHWDKATEAALRKYQGDQGWQTKTVPDSRALIQLGLGPSTDGLLNPESAMTTVPAASADPKQDPPASRTSETKPQP